MDREQSLNQNLLEKFSYALSATRSAGYLIQNISLPFVEMLATRHLRARDPEFKSHIKVIIKELDMLLKRDVNNIAQGIYPFEVLATLSPLSSLGKYAQVVEDAFGIARRKNARQTKEFSSEAQGFMDDVPEYYQRNFHFQTNGYLSEKSAKLYEYQVEILFGGAANPMRRLLIPSLRKFVAERSGDKIDGAGMHFLEIGAGTGALTKFVKMTFPQARVTVLDLSDPYLGIARENLKKFSKLNFVQGEAENLPFPNENFDGIYSCFLFHELPLEVRKKVIAEGLRVLKPEGYFGMVDSIQTGDNMDLDWAIQRFPIDFHEPFFKNYIDTPMEDLLSTCGVKNVENDQGFFSKAVFGTK
jgi:ubiquinone/menaquinone biosynthesis C-methylase UbiE